MGGVLAIFSFYPKFTEGNGATPVYLRKRSKKIRAEWMVFYKKT